MKRYAEFQVKSTPFQGPRIFNFLVLILLLVIPAQPVYAFFPPSLSDMPDTITVRGKKVALKGLKNPLASEAGSLPEHTREGGEIYIKNCFLCHGDLLDGNGLFGKSFFPQPANFLHPRSILSKPESYLYWRIMKGGKGLPPRFKPWNSAMPAWEDQLTEDEVWKVIVYLYATVRDRLTRKTSLASEPSVKRGEALYQQKCAYCHGNTGAGDGPAEAYTSPQPRNLVKGHIKIRSTPFGKIPTDEDLFRAISKGMPGTTMPPWDHLPEVDRWSLVQFIKTLSSKFERFKKRGKSHKLVSVPDVPPFTLESAASGAKLFKQNCSGCHGVKGRSDGASTKKIVDIPTDAIWPRNLTKPWKFRRGSTRKDIFTTLRTGLSGTAMPRFSPRIFKDEQIWDIVNYVQTLSPSKEPAIKHTMKASKIDGVLPNDPRDAVWQSQDANYFPLGGQILEGEKAYHPIVDSVVVKAVHNDEEIALYFQWDDPTYDPILSTLTTVRESPAPPLPPHLQMDEPEEEIPAEPTPQEFPDALAIQFPVFSSDTGEIPYFLNGDPQHPVHLWKWNSYPMGTVEINARGMSRWTPQPVSGQETSSKAIYEYGRYFLVMKRPLTTRDTDHDTQFVTGEQIPMAFNIWDGSGGETGSQKAVSSWFRLILE